ncbi:reverse transcriptase domain-containing protein [Tanacetum coccineum]
MYAGPQSVVAKAMRLGYYWPTMLQDAWDMIRKCNDYQIHRLVPRNLQQPLTPITAPLPFYKWGINIAGPFPEGPRKSCEEVLVRQHSVPLQPFGRNSLGQWSLGEGIKARLGERNKNWIEELPHVLWAHRTMIMSSHSDTLFSLTYGTEVVIPAEIRMPTYRTTVVDAMHNDEELRLNLDLLEERHERTSIRKAKAKLKMIKYYNAKVRGVTFRPGDFVYHSNDASHAVHGGKLGPKWEGPYEVMQALRDGAYMLSHLGLCGGIRQQNRQPPRSDGRHGYGDAVRSGMMSGTNLMGATNHLPLIFLAQLMLAAMASSNNISSLNAQGSLGSHTSWYMRIFSWEELGRRSRIH